MINRQDKDESERLFQELQKLEAILPMIESEEMGVVENSENRALVLKLLTGEKLFGINDSRIAKLREEVNAKARLIQEKREAYRSNYGKISKELVSLTRSFILKASEDLQGRLPSARLEREILDRKYIGASNTVTLKIKTNEATIRAFRASVAEGIKKIQAMSLKSIAVIEEEMKEINGQLEKFDLEKMEIRETTEDDYYRGQTPETPIPNYSGPRSGFKTF